MSNKTRDYTTEHKGTDLPEDYINAMVTFKNGEGKTITRKGFYSSMFGNYSMPPEYRYFGDKYLPHGFGGHRAKPDQVIKWVYVKDPERK